MDLNTIVVVSGLPRSGTSMMMKMLEAGGMEVLTDHVRTPDEDNPQGYYEFERVKQIEHDQAWLPEAKGKAFKMISALLRHLPASYQYKVIFMQRNMDEILASQKQMLHRRGEPTEAVSDERMAEVFQMHLAQTYAWLGQQSNVRVLFLDYHQTVRDPLAQAEAVDRFLDSALDIQEMAAVVDPKLHRHRNLSIDRQGPERGARQSLEHSEKQER